MPGNLCVHGDNAVLSWLFGATGSAPATWYVAVHPVSAWLASTSYSVGNWVVATSGSPNRVYQCTTAGTSGASQPTWPTTANGTVTDGTVVWTEATTALTSATSGSGLPAEVSGGGYARVSVTNTTSNWATASGGSTDNLNQIQFAVATATWGNIALVTLWDASSGGNVWGWATLSVFQNILTNNQLQFPATDLVATAT